MMRHRMGITLIGMLVAIVIVGILLLVVLELFVVAHQSYAFSMNKPLVQADAAAAVNEMAKRIRRAEICSSAAGGIIDSAFAQAEAGRVVFYTDSVGDRLGYEVSNGKLTWSDGTHSGIVVDGKATLSFRYYLTTNSDYHTILPVEEAGWVTTVTGGGLKQIIAVEITLQLSRDDLVDCFHTVVRPRNSPKKVSPTS